MARKKRRKGGKTRKVKRLLEPNVLVTGLIIAFVVLVLTFTILRMGGTHKGLSNMQITACMIADDKGTCNTRLPEIGIVLKSECCELLGKCC
jgi:hypothetical protein